MSADTVQIEFLVGEAKFATGRKLFNEGKFEDAVNIFCALLESW